MQDRLTRSEGHAAAFAACAHADQIRDVTGEPYIVHPARVVGMLRGRVTGDGLKAAWLHDVVEDCGVSLAEIRALYGPRVADLVEALTSASKFPDSPRTFREAPRAVRKAVDRERAAASDAEAQTIKVADILDNMAGILDDDREWARVFVAEKVSMLAVLTKADPALLAIARSRAEALTTILGAVKATA